MSERIAHGVIVDSSLTLAQALTQRQEIQAPSEVLDRQRLVGVIYYSFDGKPHKGQIVVAEGVIEDVKEAFRLMRRLKFPVFSVIPVGDLRFMSDDEKSAYANNSSGFNYRYIAKTDRLSNHAFGRAIDINPMQNPYIRDDYRQPEGVEYNPSVVGAITADGEIVRYFKSLGWIWGGDWEDRKDYMHFEKPEINIL